ncbi:MAG TPA: type II toxin-antitoxin system RelE/ParE family toxin [Rhizomicrobium sp.]
MIEARHYVDGAGRCPFQRWLESLDGFASARITRSLSRLANGNMSNVRAVGEGVSELKVDFGPGYRVYFGWQGATLVILLGGGQKKGQPRDIAEAKARWADYKRRR